MSFLARTINTDGPERRTEVATNEAAGQVDTPATAPATPRSVLDALNVPGRRIGRYVLDRVIGEGGMGVVYLARDPELNREIALKLLRGRTRARTGGSRVWLLREAQALAQLSHPNVLAIHDVGALGDDIFIAMELVDGQTVRRWISTAAPSPERVVEVYLGAARGLAAAHRAGLVHRDFKPDNVMLSKDGRVRVVDFGLARAATTTGGDFGPAAGGDVSPELQVEEREGETQPTSAPISAPSVTPNSEDLLGSPLTQKGVVVGTPAYMAPEQLRGEDIDARADQFAFCVSLYEALCGELPFSKRDRRRLQKGDATVTPEPPPKSADVGRALWAVLSRGMAIAPRDRFDSMEALIAGVGEAVRPARNMAYAAGAFALMVAAGAAFALLRPAASESADRTAVCDSADAEMAEVWNEQARITMRSAFRQTRLGHASGVADRVISKLGRYALSWRNMRKAACEATHVRGVQSGELLDARMTCLERRRQRLRGLVAVLSKNVNASVIDSAVGASMSLPKVSECADNQSLTERAKLPGDSTTRRQVLAIRKRLDELEALRSAGQYRAAQPVAAAIARDAANVDFARVQAEALHMLGRLQLRNDNLKRAAATLYKAATAAAKGRDDKRVAAVWLDLVWCVGEKQQRPDEGIALSKNAEIAIERAGNDPVQRAKLHFVLGALRFTKGKYAQTRELFHKSLVLREQALGKDHPDTGESASALATALMFEGRYDEARRYKIRAREIREKAFGPSHPSVARTYSELGGMAARAGKNEQARRHYRKALSVLTKAYGGQHASVADMLGNLGGVLYDLGKKVEGRDMFKRALAIRLKVFGNKHTRVAVSHYNIGLMYLYDKDYDKALTHTLESVRIYTAVHGGEHLQVADPLIGLGRSYIGLKRPDEAFEPLRRSMRIHKATRGTAHTYGEIEFALAEAHWLKGERKKSRELAKSARVHYVTSGRRSKKDLAELDLWITRHR